MNKKVDIDKLFPEDPDLTDADVEMLLDRSSYGHQLIVAGGIAAASIALFEILRKLKPSNGLGIVEEE